MDHGETTPETSRRELALISDGVRYENGRYGGTIDLHLKEL